MLNEVTDLTKSELVRKGACCVAVSIIAHHRTPSTLPQAQTTWANRHGMHDDGLIQPRARLPFITGPCGYGRLGSSHYTIDYIPTATPQDQVDCNVSVTTAQPQGQGHALSLRLRLSHPRARPNLSLALIA